jgi:hypothetical protein
MTYLFSDHPNAICLSVATSHELARAIIDRRLYRPRAVSGASGASLRLVTPDDQPPAR